MAAVPSTWRRWLETTPHSAPCWLTWEKATPTWSTRLITTVSQRQRRVQGHVTRFDLVTLDKLKRFSAAGLHPLHLAVRRDGERCLRLLVEGGAKINAPEQKSGNTSLHLAVRENLFKVACTLITEVRHTHTHTHTPVAPPLSDITA